MIAPARERDRTKMLRKLIFEEHGRMVGRKPTGAVHGATQARKAGLLAKA